MGEELSGRRIVDRFVQALIDKDFDAQDALVHEDYVERYPQSGEVIRGRVNRRAALENYEGGVGTFEPTIRVVGSEDRWVTTPALTVMRIEGSGDVYTMAGVIRYPNQEIWHIVSIMEIRDGKIAASTSYFGRPFDPPAWRSKYVEHG